MRLRPLLSVVAAATLAIGFALMPVTEAAAASPLQFGTWVADPSGTDRAGDNRQLVRETIVIKNTGSKAASLAGYRVKDKVGHTFVFPSGFTLRARASVTIHTGKGTNSSTHLYWKQGSYVWNNDTDIAYLLARTGTAKLDTCTYKAAKSGSKAC